MMSPTRDVLKFLDTGSGVKDLLGFVDHLAAARPTNQKPRETMNFSRARSCGTKRSPTLEFRYKSLVLFP